MSNNKFFKNPKIKNLVFTILEVLVVAGIIFGVLMYIYNGVNKDADKTSGVANSRSVSNKKVKNYYIMSLNIKKKALIVYKASSNLSNRKVYKVMPCSVGKKVKKHTYKTSSTYSWIKTNNGWHQYNTQYARNAYIQSLPYKNQYANTLKRKEYKRLQSTVKKSSNIWLLASDAKWIKKHCSHKTVLEIIKGKKTDSLPGNPTKAPKLAKLCGFDPTDPVKQNPYKHLKVASINVGFPTIMVEKDHKVNYLDNVIALDSKGNNVTSKVKHNSIDSSKLGSQKVTYKLTEGGRKLKTTVKFKVVDTTPPVVTIANKDFKFKLKSLDEKDVYKQSNIDKITDMVRKEASCNEKDCAITVQTIQKKELFEGDVSVVVKAKDPSGNVGSAQATVVVKVKEEKVTKFKPPKKKHKKKQKKKKVVKKKKVKKKKKSTKKKHKNKTVETTKANNETVTQLSE